MIRRNTLFTALVVAAALSLGLAHSASAKMTSWKTTDGKKFRGEPAAIVGPLAIFKTGKVTSSRVALNLLSPGDCVRFYNELNELPKRADDWANATSRVTREMFGGVRRLNNGKLEVVSLSGRPEPEYIILFSAVHDRKVTWDIMQYAIDEYPGLKNDFPGETEAFFFGNRINDLGYLEIATEINLPWLIRDIADRARMEHISELLPPGYEQLLFVTRNGVIIDGTRSSSEADVNKTMANIRLFLSLDRPGAIGAMKEREYFYRAVQPVVFATGSSDPIMVANPINADAIRAAGVQKLSATLAVDAEGKVSGVEMSGDNTLTEELSGSLSTALMRARFVPAVTDGKWVAGSYPYSLEAN